MLQVQKWGNSPGIRIPKALALKVGLEEGSEVDLDIEDGHLVIKPKSGTLDELLSRAPPTTSMPRFLQVMRKGGNHGRSLYTKPRRLGMAAVQSPIGERASRQAACLGHFTGILQRESKLNLILSSHFQDQGLSV